MNIGIYGHSIANWEDKQPFSYITKLQDYFNANIVHSGVVCCSEERILYELKKTKHIDLAIIFHTDPNYIFIPAWWRDVGTMDRDLLERKVAESQIKEIEKIPEVIELFNDVRTLYNVSITDMISYVKQNPNAGVYDMLKQHMDFGYNDLQEWNARGPEYLRELVETRITIDPEFYKELLEVLLLNKKYLYTPDLQQNRYYGALTQIDQYINYRKIPTIHCLGKPTWYPKWFKFTSGIIDTELHTFQGPKYRDKCSNNGVNEEGNTIMFNMLVNYAASSR